MEWLVVGLLGALNLQFLAVLWLSRPDTPRRRRRSAPDPAVAQRDARIVELIQAADPKWQPGDSRAHLEFLIDPQTHLISGVKHRGP